MVGGAELWRFLVAEIRRNLSFSDYFDVPCSRPRPNGTVNQKLSWKQAANNGAEMRHKENEFLFSPGRFLVAIIPRVEG